VARVGQTPAAYLTGWRMDPAAQRWRDTDDTVGTIGRSLGYTSEYAFNRAFTRARGIPPGRYCARSRGPEQPAAEAHPFPQSRLPVTPAGPGSPSASPSGLGGEDGDRER
jgi:AraC-like DNA-binding protein